MIILQKQLEDVAVQLGINGLLSISNSGYLTTICGMNICKIDKIKIKNTYTKAERKIVLDTIYDFLSNNVENINKWLFLSHEISKNNDSSVKDIAFQHNGKDYRTECSNNYDDTTKVNVYYVTTNKTVSILGIRYKFSKDYGTPKILSLDLVYPKTNWEYEDVTAFIEDIPVLIERSKLVAEDYTKHNREYLALKERQNAIFAKQSCEW